MDKEVINRHKKRWCEGDNNADESLNEAINNFNELVDNLMTPSCHRIKYVSPLDYDIENRHETNVLISDVARNEQNKDMKLMHVKLNTDLGSGSYVAWDGEIWLVGNEEHNAVMSHKTYVMSKCLGRINVQFDRSYYLYPVAIQNLTIYSDGIRNLESMDLSSVKHSVQIAKNEITETIDIGTRFIIRNKAFEVTMVDDFTSKNVRTFTVIESVANSLDDLENNMAWNEKFHITDKGSPNVKIVGDDFIYLGGTAEYEYFYATKWELEKNNIATFIFKEDGKCKIKCVSDSRFVGDKIILYATDKNGNMKEKIITIRGLF